ncbi:MAG: HlyD family type I secretion periplasmic adaptor subunit [Geobacter sp.]|nr:HlyD family type I secretion periplasmic adaptor subunit [Geobacter sp.]
MKEPNEMKQSLFSRISGRLFKTSETDPLDFSPAIVRLQGKPPVPLGRAVLKTVIVLFAGLLVWAAIGRLDIVAVADGKLVPQTYLKIVQPAEQGIVKEILVREGQSVRKGEVLLRMDAVLSDAQGKSIVSEYHRLTLTLRRIEAELGGTSLNREIGDPTDLYAQVYAQYNANRRSNETALDEQRSVLEKARQEMASAREVKKKLEQILPHYREQENAYDQLLRDGHVSRLETSAKRSERIEKEQDLRAQEFVMMSSQAIITQAQKRMEQIAADYLRQLQTERVETTGQLDKVRQELAKQRHQHDLLELKAPQAGVVKDLATHTAGTVVDPGTILMTLVPLDEPLQAEVWVSNEDVGFVRPNQQVKLKLSAYTFQKYGMIDGRVEQVSADASDNRDSANLSAQEDNSGKKVDSRLFYKTLVTLSSQQLMTDGKAHGLTPGMQVAAEIKLGTRSVLEYLFSPVSKAFQEAGRER